jgi:tetratricopeptide (TPR) repeat protein
VNARRLSTTEVARILGMREARVRELVRAGLVAPTRRGRGYAFSFQDLVVLRAAQGLLARQVPAARVRRALAALAAQLPEDRPLSGMRVFADGRHVAVRDGDGAWQPETGQGLLDFAVDELAERVERLREPATPRAADEADSVRARSELETALTLEDSDPPGAEAAYRRALELDPTLVDAYVNLGRLLHERGDARGASTLYQRALEHAPEDPIIHFNLALAFEDTAGPETAASHYERALGLDPDFADAHYNLAGVCEQIGREADALRHYHAYKKLTDG